MVGERYPIVSRVIKRFFPECQAVGLLFGAVRRPIGSDREGPSSLALLGGEFCNVGSGFPIHS